MKRKSRPEPSKEPPVSSRPLTQEVAASIGVLEARLSSLRQRIEAGEITDLAELDALRVSLAALIILNASW